MSKLALLRNYPTDMQRTQGQQQLVVTLLHDLVYRTLTSIKPNTDGREPKTQTHTHTLITLKHLLVSAIDSPQYTII